MHVGGYVDVSTKDSEGDLQKLIDRPRGTTGLLLFLVAANVAVWIATLVSTGGQPAALSTAALAYLIGIKHGFDADHIAAIDGASRKLVQQGQSASTSGLFFALGHSTIVVLLLMLFVLPTRLMDSANATVPKGFGLFGSIVSITFLFGLSLINLVVLLRMWRQRTRSGRGADEPIGVDHQGQPIGLMGWLLRGLFRFVGKAWHMYPMGLLFGLGFDTASEIALLVLSTGRAAEGASLWTIMLYPALFAAGMSLVDTVDSILVNRAYRWVGDSRARHRSYILAITAVTVVFGIGVGLVELGNLIGSTLSLSGPLWNGFRLAWDNSGMIGLAAILLVAAWNFAPMRRNRWRRTVSPAHLQDGRNRAA